uniref:(northern house mosquito) hypothetical protein n=1 Tax=Culex pipiens TaxID=7175 RepID=A0A8D8J039_CULPI
MCIIVIVYKNNRTLFFYLFKNRKDCSYHTNLFTRPRSLSYPSYPTQPSREYVMLPFFILFRFFICSKRKTIDSTFSRIAIFSSFFFFLFILKTSLHPHFLISFALVVTLLRAHLSKYL